MMCADELFQVLEPNNKNAYKFNLLGKYNMHFVFNVADLILFATGDDFDLRANPFQEVGNDANSLRLFKQQPAGEPIHYE